MNDSILIVVDIQEKFSKVIYNWDEFIDGAVNLVKGFKILGVPIVYSEQYPKGLGSTVNEISSIVEDSKRFEKTCFDCFLDEGFKKYLEESGAKRIIICGIESHICVFQTALSAKKAGYEVTVVADAVSSRFEKDYEISLKRMEQEGIILATVEMLLFSYMKNSEDEKFREISKLIK